MRLYLAALCLLPAAVTLLAQERAEAPNLQQRRQDWFYRQRAYPLPHIPAGARLRAQQQFDQIRAIQRTAARDASAPAPALWTLLGPFGSIPFNDDSSGAPDASGRVTALAIDPRNGDVAYLGGAMGGVWKTTNGGQTWTPLTDQQASLSIGSIALAPSNPDIVYVGTGEENNGIDSYYGAGILKSTDAGATWTQLPGPFVGPFETGAPAIGGGAYIGGIAVQPTNPLVVLAAVEKSAGGTDLSGIYRSSDGGTTWTRTLNGATFQVIFDAANPSRAYTAFGTDSARAGFYVSNDAGQTWQSLSTLGFSPNLIGRVAFAQAPSAPATIYAAVGDDSQGSAVLAGVAKSNDGGATWARLPIPDYCRPQCWYDDAIAVHPANPNVVFFGGSAFESGVTGSFLRSTDGGQTASDVSGNASLATAVRLHVDHHAIAFSADGTRLYDGNDGGAWRTTDPLANPIAWTSLNSTLALTQFYAGPAVHPTNGSFIVAGSQDNSTQLYSGGRWSEVNCGDGAFSVIDPVTPSNIYGTCADDGLLYKSTSAGARGTWTASFPKTIIAADNASFTPPVALDPANPSRLYFGTYRLYRSSDAAGTWNLISGDLSFGAATNFSGFISAIAVSPADPNTIWTGTTDGRVQFTQNALVGGSSATFVPVSGLPQRWVTSIAVSAQGTAYVTFSGFSGFTDTLGHVFAITVNSGQPVVIDVSGNLPNVPVNDIKIDPDVSGVLYVATDVGVLYSGDGGATWNPVSSGLPHVAVLGLAFQHSSRTLIAATHGRSMWEIASPVSAPNAVPTIAALTPPSAPAASGGVSVTVDGTNFVPASVVQWNGSARATTFVNSTRLVAAITAADVATAGTAVITVANPAPGGGTSNALNFVVGSAAVPDITNLSPGSVLGSSAGFTLMVNGDSFSTNSIVQWNGSARATTFVSSNQLQASILSGDVIALGPAVVTVFTPAPGGGTSNAVDFYVTPAGGALPLAQTRYWPHIVSGGGYVTKMTVTNLSPSNNDVIIFFLSDTGSALQTASFTLAPGETSRLATPESARFGPSSIEWAMVNSQATVGLNLFFEVTDPNTGAVLNAVGFNDQPAMTDMTVPVEVQPAPAGFVAGRAVGFALVNPSSVVTANVTLKLLDRKGNVLATAPLALPPLVHTSLDLQSFAPFAAVLPSGSFIGTVTISSDVAIVTAALQDDLGPFSALPPMPGRAK